MGTLFCENPELFEGGDEEEGNGVDDVILRQAEGASAGGRELCALDRWKRHVGLQTKRIDETSLPSW